MHLREIYTNVAEHANEHAYKFSTQYSKPFSRYCAAYLYCALAFYSEKVNFENESAVTFEPLVRFT